MAAYLKYNFMPKKTLLYIHDFIPLTEVEGPGKRACLWLQGCSIRCKGCMAPHTWEQREGRPIAVDDLFNQLTSSQEIEGVTILGGEPMDQAEALLPLLAQIRAIPLSIMLFTGYCLEQLTTPAQQQIIALCDLLIDGPYIQSLTDFSRPWIGSKNQQIHYLTDKYLYLKNQLSPTINHPQTSFSPIEIRISATGEIKINGMFPDSLLSTLQREFGSI